MVQFGSCILSFRSLDALDIAVGATLNLHPWARHTAGRADLGKAYVVRAVRGTEEVSGCFSMYPAFIITIKYF